MHIDRGLPPVESDSSSPPPLDLEGLGGTDEARQASGQEGVWREAPLDAEEGELPRPKKRRRKRPVDVAPGVSIADTL